MFIVVFVLGRPGCGKTTAVQHFIELAERRSYSTCRIKDYEMLYRMYEADTEHIRFYPADFGGFNVRDFSVLDEALTALEKEAETKKSLPGHGFILLEFARDDYRKALSQFSPDFLRNSYVLFLETDVDTCIERIHKRITWPISPDHHYVSDEIVRNYYDKENLRYMCDNFRRDSGIQKKVRVIENTGTLESFLEQVSQFAEDVFAEDSFKLPKTLLSQEAPLPVSTLADTIEVIA